MTSEDIGKATRLVVNPTFRIAEIAFFLSVIVTGAVWVTKVDERVAPVGEINERLHRLENAYGILENDAKNMKDDIRRLWRMRRSGAQPKKTAFHSKAVCAPHRSAVKQLLKRHKEQMIWRGQIGADWVMELFVSPGGSWTLLNTGLNGVSCVRAAGHSSEFAKPKRGHPGI